MKKNFKRTLGISLFILLSGCEQNTDIALLSSYPAFGSCAIDTPQANVTLPSDQDFTVGGWAYDEKNKSIPDTLTLYLINEDTLKISTFPATRGTKRPDVAAAFKLPKLIGSGFNSFISKNSLTPGTYQFVLIQTSRVTGVISCNGLKHKITIQ